MRSCVCSLPDMYGPEVCKRCSNALEDSYPQNPTTAPYSWQPKTKNIKRITRTIDKYDAEGKLIGREVITEEVEDIEKEVWEPMWGSSGTIIVTSTNQPVEISGNTVTYKNDTPFTLTNGVSALSNTCLVN